MLPGVYHLSLYRGDTAKLQFKLWSDLAKTIPFDLSGATPEAQIRERPDSEIVVRLICTTASPNIVNVTVPAIAAGTLAKHNVWDLQLSWDNGEVQTVVQGAASAAPDVTRA